MTTITIQLPDDTAARVEDAARELGLTPEDLVQTSVEEKLTRLSMSFDDVVKHVVDKNAELYKRLS